MRSTRLFRYEATRIAVFISSILSRQCAVTTNNENEMTSKTDPAVDSVPLDEIAPSREAAESAKPKVAVTAAAAALANK